MVKKMFTLLIAVLFVVPFVVAADDFDDDFGGGFDDESEDSEEDEDDAPAKKKSEAQYESDAAMKDLMGDPDEEKTEEKEQKKSEADAEETAAPAEEKVSEKSFKGIRPILLVKGGFTLLGSYKYKDESGKLKNPNAMFGSVDEGILGLEYQGKHVIAKGTVNLRTDNALVQYAVNNPLIKTNLHSIQDGAANAIYEVYGGVKFFDVFIKAGNMIPEYGLVDTWQNLGMGFSTPFLTRSLIVVEGFLPETDAGFSIGYNSTFAKDHNIFAGLTLGTGSNKSEFWYTDKTLGIYGRIGYGFKEYVKAAFAFQHRKDFYNSKKLDMTGIGIHAYASVKGFEMPLTFDYNMMQMVKDTLRKNVSGMLLSLAPGYAYHFDHEWIDKVALALRFDFVQGIYTSREGFYLDFNNYQKSKSYMRIGVTANFFTKELAGVRGMAGLTFLMQPKAKISKTEKDYGFTTVVLQAGAEF